MPKTRPPYPPEFRARIVELVRSGRTAEALSREFEATATTIRKWVKQADIDEGRQGGVTTDEKEELGRLRRENEKLRTEREVLKKAAA